MWVRSFETIEDLRQTRSRRTCAGLRYAYFSSIHCFVVRPLEREQGQDEARRAVDAEERDLLLKIVGQVVRPVVVPQPQPAGGAGAGAAEAFADTLAEGLQGLEAGPALGGMKTDALDRASGQRPRR